VIIKQAHMRSFELFEKTRGIRVSLTFFLGEKINKFYKNNLVN